MRLQGGAFESRGAGSRGALGLGGVFLLIQELIFNLAESVTHSVDTCVASLEYLPLLFEDRLACQSVQCVQKADVKIVVEGRSDALHGVVIRPPVLSPEKEQALLHCGKGVLQILRHIQIIGAAHMVPKPE